MRIIYNINRLKDKIEKLSIAVGIPAKIIKYRE